MKCPICGEELIIEDQRVDTDRGVFGDILCYCEECDYQEGYE